MNRSSEKGVSLLSMLVSVALIAVLAVLLLSVSGKMTASARSVSCVSNLRQIGTALHAYLADHNGQYPPNRANPDFKTEENPAGVHHQDSLKVYLRPYPDKGVTITAELAGPFWCPADLSRREGLAQHSYGANTYIGGAEPREEGNIRREPQASRRLYLVDSMRESLSTCMFSHNTWPFGNTGSSKEPSTDIRVDFRHDGKANGLFLDGHVETFALRQLRGADPRKTIALP